MELDSLIGSGRWNILEILAVKPSSPIELSSKLKTSTAYISQQLKLLEAAGLIRKEKTGRAEKNQPRNIYHISREFLSLTLLATGNPKRKSIAVNEHQKITLNIWLLEDERLHYILQKAFWEIEEELDEIKGMLIDNSKPKKVLYVISDSKKVSSNAYGCLKAHSSLIECQVVSSSAKKDFSNFYVIYDPLNLTKGKNMKGGDD